MLQFTTWNEYVNGCLLHDISCRISLCQQCSQDSNKGQKKVLINCESLSVTKSQRRGLRTKAGLQTSPYLEF